MALRSRSHWRVGAALALSSVVVGSGIFFRKSFDTARPSTFVGSKTDAGLPFELAGLRLPTGEQPRLSCESARSVVHQARANIFREPKTLDESRFSLSTIDWLDPHGFWSAAKEAPIAKEVERSRHALLQELEEDTADCVAARFIGVELEKWVTKLREAYETAPQGKIDGALSEALFDERQLEMHPLATAAALGANARILRATFGSDADRWIEVGESRFLPRYDAERWSEILLAAEVRAYVAALDPHGAWAPLDEESSVYDLNLTDRPPSLLYDASVRTSFGLLVEGGARGPLRDGDVLFAMGGHALAGLSVEESDQLAAAFAEAEQPFEITLVRDGKIERVAVLPEVPLDTKESPLVGLDTETLDYGSGHVALVHIRDVRDSLGEELSDVLHALPRDLEGIVLDLRGNSGGSTDGAAHALGAFLPHAPLFPMLHRDGTIEVQAAEPSELTYDGPLAALVDRDTASAAEMIAGALLSYRRAPVIGETTFGKGCAQEYIDDVASVGVLRLTTLVFSLPDGTALQGKGLTPSFPFAFQHGESSEAERLLPNSFPSWAGPDVRDAIFRTGQREPLRAWPAHGGRVNGCDDPLACKAIQLLGRHPVAKNVPQRR